MNTQPTPAVDQPERQEPPATAAAPRPDAVQDDLEDAKRLEDLAPEAGQADDVRGGIRRPPGARFSPLYAP